MVNLSEAATACSELRHLGLRVELDENNESVGKKIRDAEKSKLPYALVIGDKEVDANSVAVRKHGGEDLGTMKLEEFAEFLKQEVAAK